MEHEVETGTVAQPPRRWTEKLWEKRIFIGSAAVSGACAAIAVIGQVNFYSSIDKLPKAIAYLFPIGVESISWVMGAAAAYCVAKNLPSAKYSRRMWAFAVFAAAVNIWHGVQHINLSVGVVLGLASVFGPFVWHSYTGMTRIAMSGKSLEEIKVAAKTRLFHPVLAVRAARIQTLLQCSSGEAWTYALTYKTKEVRNKVRESLEKKLERSSLSVLTVDAKPVEIPKPPAKPKPATAKPAAESKPETKVEPVKAPELPAPPVEDTEKPAPPVDITLVRQYGDKRAKAISLWLARLDEGNGNGPSLRSIDIAMSGSYTGTAKNAVAAYIKDHGDPRQKRQQQRKEVTG